MTIRITLLGATGWVGKELVQAIGAATELSLLAAFSRSGMGRDVAEAVGKSATGVTISTTLEEALAVPSDVVIDYTKPDVVKKHALASLASGRHLVIGTSRLSETDYDEIDRQALLASRGVLAAGNFSITATLMARFALEAARYVRDVEIIDYAGSHKVDAPSGTARELAEMLGHVRMSASSRPVAKLFGIKETRGGQVGSPNEVQIHFIRIPSYVLSCEVVMGAESERLSLRHDSGSSAAPYVAGTLLAARRVPEFVGLKRGLAAVM